MQQHIDFPMEISVPGNLMENPLIKIAFLNDQNTLEIHASPSHFWFSHV